MNENQTLPLLIQSSGNQQYIFDSNRLRENLGASELIYRSTTVELAKALGALFGFERLTSPDPQGLDALWLDEDRSPRLERDGIEVVYATSGNALLLFGEDKARQARELITRVTKQALIDAPGLELRGVIGPAFTSGHLHDAIKETYGRFEVEAGRRPAAGLRFPTLPILETCPSTGLPAETTARSLLKDRETALSVVAQAKRRARDDGLARLNAQIESEILPLSDNIGILEQHIEGLSWIAILHMDGNGVGQILQDFPNLAREAGLPDDDSALAEAMRSFSAALDGATQRAVRGAVGELAERLVNGPGTTPKFLPIVPIVLGGDDVTLLMDGRRALSFTHDVLTRFEQESRDKEILRKLTKGSGLTACAGIAIVKPHYPFHGAYEIAEELLASAKRVKALSVPASALDYHVNFDSSGHDLELIRDRLRVDGGETRLFQRPYLVTPEDTLATLPGETAAWAAAHHWSALKAAMSVLPRCGGDVDPLPNSALHEVRQALFRGADSAQRHLELVIGHNGREAQWHRLLGAGTKDAPVLFFKGAAAADRPDEVETASARTQRTTRLTDALELMDLW